MAPRRVRSAPEDKKEDSTARAAKTRLFDSSENDSDETNTTTTTRVAKTELAKLKKAHDQVILGWQVAKTELANLKKAHDQVTAERDAARTEIDAIRSERDAIRSERDEARADAIALAAALADKGTGLDTELNDANDDADAGLLRATALAPVAEKVTGLEAKLDSANDDTDAGENATALAERAAGLDTELDDANDDADLGLVSVTVLAEEKVGLGAESDVRRVRRSVGDVMSWFLQDDFGATAQDDDDGGLSDIEFDDYLIQANGSIVTFVDEGDSSDDDASTARA